MVKTEMSFTELSSLAVANFYRGPHRPYGAPQSYARSLAGQADHSTVTLEGGKHRATTLPILAI